MTTSWTQSNSSHRIVRLHCEDPTAQPFNVHQGRLEIHARFLEIHRGENDTLTAKVNASFNSLSHFVSWLYYGDTAVSALRGDYPFLTEDTLHVLLNGYAVGKEIGCFEYADIMIDQIIDDMTIRVPEVCAITALKVFSRAFEPNSGGWKMALELLLFPDDFYCPGDCAQHTLKDLADDRMVIELAKRTQKHTFDAASEPIENAKFCKVFVSGFFHERGSGDVFDFGIEPGENNCEYHLHEQLGLPCYAAKKAKPVINLARHLGTARERDEVADWGDW